MTFSFATMMFCSKRSPWSDARRKLISVRVRERKKQLRGRDGTWWDFADRQVSFPVLTPW